MPRYLTKKQKLALVLALTMNLEHRPNKKKRVWSKQHLLEKEQLEQINLLRELDNNDFRNCLRMDDVSFEHLLNLVKPLITKQDTVMRQAVSAEDRLGVTLKYLSMGKDYSDLAFSSGISSQSLSRIIPETCEAIYKVLKNYIKIPATENEWLKVAKQYQRKWQFHHCVGAMDGRHILVVKPKKRGSLYYNYSGTFSIVLFAVVDANHEFLYVHTGSKGSLSDGPVLEYTRFYEKLIEDELNLPQASLLPGTDLLAPYVFLTDSGFAMSEHNLEPYSEEGIIQGMKIFNYRLSRAHRVAENAFGILASRFQVFQKPILVDIQHVDKIVMASCVLHNYLIKTSENYITSTCVDYEDIQNGILRLGQWRKQTALLPLQKHCSHQTNSDHVRTVFKDYFNGPGTVNFQGKMLNAKNKCLIDENLPS